MSSEVVYNTPLPERGDFKDWSNRFKARQDETGVFRNELEFTFTAPILINLIADMHVGHPTTNYARIEQEADEIVKTANSFVMILGDQINNLNWNPGQMEEMEQPPEQIEYVRSFYEYLATYNKLLLVMQGDHDGWLLKAGFDMLTEVPDHYGAHATHGITQVTANVEEQAYKMGMAHQLPGHSIYNVVHPQMRAERFGGLRGSDIIVSGHNHKKGYATDYQQNFDGTHQVHYIALGPYKETDAWLAKKGFKRQDPTQMFGAAIHLEAEKKHIVYVDDIVEANQRKRGKHG